MIIRNTSKKLAMRFWVNTPDTNEPITGFAYVWYTVRLPYNKVMKLHVIALDGPEEMLPYEEHILAAVEAFPLHRLLDVDRYCFDHLTEDYPDIFVRLIPADYIQVPSFRAPRKAKADAPDSLKDQG